MDAILLPGNSIKNKDQLLGLEKAVKPLFNKTTAHYYHHWSNPDFSINIDKEVSTLIAIAKSSKDLVIIAKSIGSFITLKAISLGLKPKKCIFLGFPIIALQELNLFEEAKDLLANQNTPLLFIHNSLDPYCSYTNLISFLSNLNIKNYQARELTDPLTQDTHTYDNYPLLKQIIKDFVF